MPRAAAALALAALALAGGHAGPLADGSARLAAAVCAALASAAALLGPRPRPGLPVLRLAAWVVLAPAGLFCVTHAPPPEGPTAAVLLFLLAAHLLGRRLAPPSPLDGAALTAAGSALLAWEILTNRLPPVWVFTEQATRAITEALGRLGGAGTSLGPSVAGLPLLILCLAYVFARLRRGGPMSRSLAILAAAWVVVIAACGWALGVPLALRAFHALNLVLGIGGTEMPVAGYPASVAVFLPAILFSCWLVPILVLAAPGTPAPDAARLPPGGVRARGGAATAILAAAGAAAALLAALPLLRLPASGEAPRVSFLDRGMLDWALPAHGQLGLERAGMFGLLPRYLEAAGCKVSRSASAASAAALAGTDVLVVINPTSAFPGDERSRLVEFVRAGGGLVVMGDHTDLSGIMAPLNDLLAPFGISFRFDSAFTPHHWRNDAGFLPGPMTRALDGANSRFQQSTGASLVLESGAQPVATARWGFSDAGDRANEDNAFLGDYIYQASEPIGDIAVVAVGRLGRGRAVVFGDTSAFQNVAMPFSWPFVARAFQTAAGRDLPLARSLAWAGAALLGFCLASMALLPREGAGAALAAGIVAGLLAAGAASARLEPALELTGPRIAVVDAAHFNDVSLGLWDKEALGGLNMNLARNGYLPLLDREGRRDLLHSASAYVTVAPRRPFTTAEIEALGALAERGGEVIAAAGWEEREPAEGILRLAGFDLSAVPLGPIPVLKKITDGETFERLQSEPHFAEAWPVEGVVEGRDDVLYASDGFPVVVRRKIGQGSFTLIADSRFLMNGTLEEEGAAWQGNVAFLRRLLRHGYSAVREARP